MIKAKETRKKKEREREITDRLKVKRWMTEYSEPDLSIH